MPAQSFRYPKTSRFDFPGFTGVVDRVDPSLQPVGTLSKAKNLRFDRQRPRIRPGFDKHVLLTDRPLDGLAQWVIPKGADQPETRHDVAFGWRFEAGSPVPLVMKNTGLLPDPNEWEEATVNGELVGTGLDVFTAQLREKLYFVNGLNGLAYYSGFGFNGADINVVEPVAASPVPTVNVLDRVLVNTNSAGWHETDPSDLHLTELSYPDPLATANGVDFLNILDPANAVADGDYVYKDLFGASLVKDGLLDRASNSLVFTFVTTSSEPSGQSVPPNFRVVLGRIDPGDATTDPADPSYVFNKAWAFAWELDGSEVAGGNGLVDLSLENVPPVVTEQADYFLLLVTKAPETTFVGLGFVPYSTWLLSSVHVMGPVPDGITFWKTQFRDDDTLLYGEASLGSKGEVVSPEKTVTTTGGATTSTFSQPKGIVEIVVSFRDTDPDFMDLYRAVTEPIAGLTQNGEGLNYHFSQTILKPAGIPAGGTQEVTVYDNVDDPQLRANSPLDARAQSTGFPGDPPRFIAASHQRLAVACSNAHPYRVWLSDILNELSFPDEAFEASKEIGRGGYIDVENQEAVTGLTTMGRDFIIFTEHGVYALIVQFEATGDETWNLVKLVTGAGCVGGRAYAHVPGALLWASQAGVYYLTDTNPQSNPQPVSADVQGTWDKIPDALKRQISMDYHPTEHLLLLTYGTGLHANGQNDTVLPLDFRTKSQSNPFGAWAGDWMVVHDQLPDFNWFQPSRVYVLLDRDGVWQTYFTRYDTGQIDRWMVPGVDPDPYRDYGAYVRMELWTGWVNPDLGQRFKPIRRRIRLSYDEGADVDGRVTFALSVRPPALTRTYFHTAVVNSAQDKWGGVVTIGGARGAAEFHPDLVGNEIRCYLQLSCSTTKEVRIDGISLDLQPTGEQYAENEGTPTDSPFWDNGSGDAPVFPSGPEGPAPHAPTASNVVFGTDKNVPVAVALAATDPDGDPLTYQVVTGPSHGTLGAVAGNVVTYTPATDYVGADSFTFKANNGSFDSNTATAYTPVADPEHPVVGPVPDGLITFWDSRNGPVPTGWLVCNGISSTPDLVTGNPLLTMGAASGRTLGVLETLTKTVALLDHHHNGKIWMVGDDTDAPQVLMLLGAEPGDYTVPLGGTLTSNDTGDIFIAGEGSVVPPHVHSFPSDVVWPFVPDVAKNLFDRYDLVPIVSRSAPSVAGKTVLLLSGSVPGGWTETAESAAARDLFSGFDPSYGLPHGRMFVRASAGLSGHQESDEGIGYGHLYEQYATSDVTMEPRVAVPAWDRPPSGVQPVPDPDPQRSFNNPTGHNHTLPVGLSVSGKAASVTLKGHSLSAFSRVSAVTNLSDLPASTVFLWDLSTGAVPVGWKVCDGTVATPDLVTGHPFLQVGGEGAAAPVLASGGLIGGVTPHPGDGTLVYDPDTNYTSNSGEYNEYSDIDHERNRQPVHRRGGDEGDYPGMTTPEINDRNVFYSAEPGVDFNHFHTVGDLAPELAADEFWRDNITRYQLVPIMRS